MLWALGARGLKLTEGHDDAEHLRTFQLVWTLVLILVALALASCSLVWRRPLGWRPVAVGALLAPALLWSASTMVLLHSEIHAYDQDPGLGMFVPGLDPVADGLRERLTPPTPLPRVWHDGILVFDPAYGLCAEPPYPCPGWNGTRAPV